MIDVGLKLRMISMIDMVNDSNGIFDYKFEEWNQYKEK